MSVDHWFDHMPNDWLDDKKEGERPKQHGPGGVDSDGKSQRERSSDSRADVRHEAQHGRQDAPQDRAWNTNQPQARPDNYAEGAVQKQLNQKKPAEAPRCVVKLGCGTLQIMRTRQSDQPIAKDPPAATK